MHGGKRIHIVSFFHCISKKVWKGRASMAAWRSNGCNVWWSTAVLLEPVLGTALPSRNPKFLDTYRLVTWLLTDSTVSWLLLLIIIDQPPVLASMFKRTSSSQVWSVMIVSWKSDPYIIDLDKVFHINSFDNNRQVGRGLKPSAVGPSAIKLLKPIEVWGVVGGWILTIRPINLGASYCSNNKKKSRSMDLVRNPVLGSKDEYGDRDPSCGVRAYA